MARKPIAAKKLKSPRHSLISNMPRMLDVKMIEAIDKIRVRLARREGRIRSRAAVIREALEIGLKKID